MIFEDPVYGVEPGYVFMPSAARAEDLPEKYEATMIIHPAAAASRLSSIAFTNLLASRSSSCKMHSPHLSAIALS